VVPHVSERGDEVLKKKLYKSLKRAAKREEGGGTHGRLKHKQRTKKVMKPQEMVHRRNIEKHNGVALQHNESWPENRWGNYSIKRKEKIGW